MAFGRPSERDDARELTWRLWFQRQNPLAIAAFVLSVFSLTHLGTLIVDESVGIVLGVVALVQLRRVRERFAGADDPPWFARPDGHALAWAGIGLGVGSLLLACVVYLWPHFSRR
jgi:hypothetical protein